MLLQQTEELTSNTAIFIASQVFSS